MRIVSLTCSNTEIVCALGLADWLVGVDNHSDYPVEVVNALPRVGPDLGIDLDAVAALSPDLVLASLTVPGHEAIVDGLAERGLPHLAPEPVSLADVYADIALIAGHCGVPERGEALVAQMQAAMPPRALSRRPKVLVEWWPKPVIVPGAQSWVTDLIRLAGGENPLGEAAVKSRGVTDAEVGDWNPDAVVISWCGVPTRKYRPEVVTRRPAWAGVKAVQTDRVVPIAEAYMGRPGPRLVDGYLALCRIIDGVLSAEDGV